MEESYVHGMSVARVARKYGINANQVFQWRRLQQDGLLGPAAEGSEKLLPVSVIQESGRSLGRKLLRHLLAEARFILSFPVGCRFDWKGMSMLRRCVLS